MMKMVLSMENYLTLQVYLTYKCNSNCKYCNVRKRNVDLDIDTYKVMLSTLDSIGTIIFIGGEPTLHPSLGEFLQVSKEYSKKVEVITNGTFDTKTKHLLYNFDTVLFSIDGSREYNLKVRGIDTDLVLENLKDISEFTNVKINKVVYREEIEQGKLEENVKFVRSLGFPINYIFCSDFNWDFNTLEKLDKDVLNVDLHPRDIFNQKCKHTTKVIAFYDEVNGYVLGNCTLLYDNNYLANCLGCPYINDCISCIGYDRKKIINFNHCILRRFVG